MDRYGFIMAFLKWFYFAGIDPTIYQFILLTITLGTPGKSLGIKRNKTNAYIVWNGYQTYPKQPNWSASFGLVVAFLITDWAGLSSHPFLLQYFTTVKTLIMKCQRWTFCFIITCSSALIHFKLITWNN